MKIKREMMYTDATRRAASKMDCHATFKIRELIDTMLDDNGNNLGEIKLDMVEIQVDDNWGNKIYTTRDGANALYRKYCSGELRPATITSDTMQSIFRVLKGENHEYCVGTYLIRYYEGGVDYQPYIREMHHPIK